MRIYSGGTLQVPEKSLCAILFDTTRRFPDRIGVKHRKAGSSAFTSLPWREVEATVREVGNGLLSLGIAKGDRVALLSDTRWEWSLSDYGILACGGISVTVYPTLTAEQIAYLLNDSGSKAIFVENAAQFAKIEQVAKDLRTVKQIILLEPIPSSNALAKMTMTLDQLREAGRTHALSNPKVLDERVLQVKPDDVATIVYTSGTTGVPKGAIITHRNFVSAYEAAQKVLRVMDHAETVLFLPLAHCYARLIQFYIVDRAGTINYSSPRTLGDDLRAVNPQLIASVPRLYERMYDQIQNAVAQGPANKRRIFERAEATAKEMGKARANGGVAGLGLRIRHFVFDRLVYSKLREKLGMTRLEVGFTGAAAIRPDLLYFFQGIGVNILEGYGLTETAAPSNVNPPGKYKPGSVGPPFPGMEQFLDTEGIEQPAGGRVRGEICMRGPNIFQGYYNQPKETAECFADVEGKRWFRSGDIGEFDDDGFLKIVDRKKELEVLDTGKKVAPINVEETLKGSPWISEALFTATGHKFGGALVQPNYDRLVPWAKEKGVKFDMNKVVVKPDPTGNPMTYSVGEDLLAAPEVQKLYSEEIVKANTRLADFEHVKVFRLVPHAFTMDRDELTPTLKKKRRIITKNHAGLIEDMFRGK